MRRAKVIVEDLKKVAPAARPALVDGALAGAGALRGRPRVVLLFTIDREVLKHAGDVPHQSVHFDYHL